MPLERKITEGEPTASVNQVRQPDHSGSFKDRAKTFHFEPQEDELRIRYRIDGHFSTREPLPPRSNAAGLAHLTHQGDERMNIDEKRLQQGRQH